MTDNDTIPCQIYLITPPSIPDMDVFLKHLEAAITAAPVACLQIRLKTPNGDVMDSSDVVQAARAIVPLCHSHGVDVIINDDPTIVDDCGADGVHIGQNDMDYFSARELLGGDAIIGVTCHNSKELAFKAAQAGADYVAFGAFFDTPTKTPKARAELEILEWWQEAVEIPCVAIGGITVANAASVIAAGADFIAVSSGIWAHPDGPASAVSALSALCHSAQD
ncbi:thiamine phosphate synthase [Fretibacter rubidus]|uniref:thiamine phosphate synthase n=1 Tax=Fretibacter rubidus TaxID=570162 RepID=UPI00352BAF40